MIKLRDGTVLSEGHNNDAVAAATSALVREPGLLDKINDLLGAVCNVNVVLVWRDGDLAKLPVANLEFVREGNAAVAVNGNVQGTVLLPFPPLPGASSAPVQKPKVIDSVLWGVEGEDGMVPIPDDYLIVQDGYELDEDGDKERVITFGPAGEGKGERLLPVRDRDLAKVKRVKRDTL